MRAALGPDVKLEVVSPDRRRPPYLVGRELACMLVLPFQLRALR